MVLILEPSHQFYFKYIKSRLAVWYVPVGSVILTADAALYTSHTLVWQSDQTVRLVGLSGYVKIIGTLKGHSVKKNMDAYPWHFADLRIFIVYAVKQIEKTIAFHINLHWEDILTKYTFTRVSAGPWNPWIWENIFKTWNILVKMVGLAWGPWISSNWSLNIFESWISSNWSLNIFQSALKFSKDLKFPALFVPFPCCLMVFTWNYQSGTGSYGTG